MYIAIIAFCETDSAVCIPINVQPQSVRVVWFLMSYGRNCSQESKKKQKTHVVLKHYDEVPEVLPDSDFKPKCKYCGKEITGNQNEQLMFIRCNHTHTSQ